MTPFKQRFHFLLLSSELISRKAPGSLATREPNEAPWFGFPGQEGGITEMPAWP